MANMFQNASSFNQSLVHWDVSNVTTMEDMFKGATSFKRSLDSWIVGHVLRRQLQIR
jgi:hypothetical protein